MTIFMGFCITANRSIANDEVELQLARNGAGAVLVYSSKPNPRKQTDSVGGPGLVQHVVAKLLYLSFN